MITLQMLVLSAAVAAPGQTVLMEFHADSCGPCRSMEPTVRRLISEGHAIRKVNVEQEQQLARRFRVDRIPTFVMLADGQEVQRVVGPVSYDQLRQVLAAAAPATNASSVPTQFASAPAAVSSAAGTSAAENSAADPQQRALYATVRLRIHDPSGTSYGTGTIIDARASEALVITCGHLFRDSSGQGRIEIDLFAPGARSPVPGKLLAYDLKNDVALVAIWPSVPITPVRIAAGDYQVGRGDPVFSIGCDRGQDPSIRPSRVTALNKYQGPANIEVAGQPVIGRSGGGLFSADGQLIGVCNAADPKDDEGLYAALSLLHEHLAANLPKGVLQTGGTQLASDLQPPAASLPQQVSSTPPPALPREMPGLLGGHDRLSAVPPPGGSAASDALTALLLAGGEDAEVICIVRSKSNPDGLKQLLIIDRPTRDLLDYLAAQNRAAAGEPTILLAEQPSAAIAQPDRYQNSGQGQVLRGQLTR